MVLMMPLEMALASSSTLLWVYVVMRFSLSLLFIIVAIRLSDKSIQKTLRRAREHWNPRYSDYTPEPHKGESYWKTTLPNMPEVQRRGRNSIYVPMGMILAFVLGIGSREAMLLMASTNLENVHIVSKVSDKEFMLWTKQEGDIHSVFCHPVPFEAGMVLKSIKYENRVYCWSVQESGLSYFIDQGETNHGRNAYSNSYAHSNSRPYTYASR